MWVGNQIEETARRSERWRSNTEPVVCQPRARRRFVMHQRLRVVSNRGGFSQRAERVERGETSRGVLHSRRLARDLPPQFFEDLHLALGDAFVGAKHFFFVGLQIRCDEPLATGNRLLAMIVGRHVRQIRPRDLDVVAEHAVEANFQRADAGARALGILHLGDPLLSRPADAAKIVELRIDAVADDAAIAGIDRRLVEKRAIEIVAQVREIVEFGGEAADERRLKWFQQHTDARNRRHRLPQRDEIARSGRAQSGAGYEPLDIVNRLQRFADLRAFGTPKRKLFDRIESILDPLERQQRPQQPGAQQASAHRGERSIDLLQQRPVPAAIRGFDDLEVPERGRIDDHRVGAGPKGQVADVREFGLLRFAEVVHERAGRARRRGTIFQAKADERLRSHLRQHRGAGGLELEGPAVADRHAGFQAQLIHQGNDVIDTGGGEDFPGPENGELVGKSMPRIGSQVFGRRELTG